MAELSRQPTCGSALGSDMAFQSEAQPNVRANEPASVVDAEQLHQRSATRLRAANSSSSAGFWNVRNDVFLVLTLAKQQLCDVQLENENLRLTNERLKQALADASRRGIESERLAHHDVLTGLPNRLLLKEHLQKKIDEAVKRQSQLALLFIDLDGFKTVNDRYGHIVGDRLLAAVAKRIVGSIRSHDLACRFGGDEFVVLLTNVSEATVAASIAKTIRDRISECYSIDAHTCRITASIGLALYPSDGEHGDALLRRADAAMYNCKQVRLSSNGASAS